jgi:hypothetical protein
MPRILLAVATLGACAGAAVALASGFSGESQGERCGAWADSVEGRPTEAAVSKPSFLVWHNGRGWHLRATTPAHHETARFQGRIATAGKIRDARSRGRERTDELLRARRSVAFDFRTRGGDTDGFDFAVRCGSVRFSLRPRSRQVLLGSAGRAPAGRFTASDPAASGVRGRVVTEPTCPVERAGEDCSPRPLQTTVDVFVPPAEPPDTPAKSVATDSSGRFRIELAPGRYRLVPRPTNPAASAQPQDVAVSDGIVTDVTLTVDSGLR